MPNQPTRARKLPRLLYIDESAVIYRGVANALTDCFHVVPARNGAAARGKLQTAKPDLVVVELMLPDIDGLLLMVELKALTDAPIVVCSGRDDPVDRALARRLGAADFIAKPIKLKELPGRLLAATTGQLSSAWCSSKRSR